MNEAQGAPGDVFNEFGAAISQVPISSQLLPFEAKAKETKSGESQVDYKYEPSAQAVLEKLMPQAVAVEVYRALLESFAAEHAARMSAMENATRNAGDMIGALTLFHNRSRQAQITKELVEIVSGAEALALSFGALPFELFRTTARLDLACRLRSCCRRSRRLRFHGSCLAPGRHLLASTAELRRGWRSSSRRLPRRRSRSR